MDDKYIAKEEARMALVAAIRCCKHAAERYGMDILDMENEIESAIFEAGFPDVALHLQGE